MKLSIDNTLASFGFVAKTGLFCAALSFPLLSADTALTQPNDLGAVNASTRGFGSQEKALAVAGQERGYGAYDQASIDVLVQFADRQSSIGEYGNAISNLKQALQLNRINNGLYHDSQIEIVDELIANEILMENWEAVNHYYDLEELLYRRLFELTDARLEVGLEKITAWHISAINEDIDDNAREHLTKLRELLAIRLGIVENLLGNDNARYEFIFATLEHVEFELKKLRAEFSIGAGMQTPAGPPTRTKY